MKASKTIDLEDPRQSSRSNPSLEDYVAWDILALIFVTAAFYLAGYLKHPAVPELHSDHVTGWMGWFDQGEYYKSAADLSNFKLKPSFYWYGYPLIGALAIRFLPNHAFLIPDLTFVCGMVVFFYVTCKRFLKQWEAWLLALIAFVADPQLWDNSLIVPWNTIPVYFAVFLTAWLVISDFRSYRYYLIVSGFIGLAAFCRPPDTAALLLLYMCGLFRRPALDKIFSRILAPFFFVGLAAILQCSAHLYLYHSINSPYMAMVGSVGFNFSRLFLKLYQVFVDPTLISDHAMLPPGTKPAAIIDRIPYILLTVPGLFLMVKETGGRFLGFIAAVVLTFLLYLGFNPSSYPHHFWSYLLFHYLWWFAPWAALAAWLTVTRAWRAMNFWLYSALLLLPILFFTIAAFQEKIVAELPVRLTATGFSSEFADQKEASVEANLLDGNLRFRIVPPLNKAIAGLRLYGDPILPFFASVAGSNLRFYATFDGDALRTLGDYFPAGYPQQLSLSFINHPLVNHGNRALQIEIHDITASRPTGLILVDLVWAPGANWRRWWEEGNEPKISSSNASLWNINFGSGWSEGGNDFLWSIGPKSDLTIFLAHDVVLQPTMMLDLGAFRPQVVSLFLDHKKIADLNVNGRSIFRLPIPALIKKGPHDVCLSVSNPTRPVDIGMNSDRRALGCALYAIDIAESAKIKK